MNKTCCFLCSNNNSIDSFDPKKLKEVLLLVIYRYHVKKFLFGKNNFDIECYKVLNELNFPNIKKICFQQTYQEMNTYLPEFRELKFDAHLYSPSTFLNKFDNADILVCLEDKTYSDIVYVKSIAFAKTKGKIVIKI